MVLRFWQHHRFCNRETIPGILLFGCWIAGSSLGLLTARFQGDVFLPFFQILPGTLPGVIGMAVSVVFPLFISACAVVLFCPAVCYIFCLLRSISQGLLLGMLLRIHGSAAVLMAMLLMFSGLCVNPVMLVFWLRRLERGLERFKQDTIVCCGICLIIGLIDFWVIAPFLSDVMNF